MTDALADLSITCHDDNQSLRHNNIQFMTWAKQWMQMHNMPHTDVTYIVFQALMNPKAGKISTILLHIWDLMGHYNTIYMLLGNMSEQQSMGLPLAYFASYLIQLPNSKPTVKDNMTFPAPIYSKWKIIGHMH